jgi:transposase InsO family protein
VPPQKAEKNSPHQDFPSIHFLADVYVNVYLVSHPSNLTSMSKTNFLDRDHVIALVERINAGEVSLADALLHLRDLRGEGIEINVLHVGRRPAPPPSDVIKFIKEKYASTHYGCTIMHSFCVHRGFTVSEYRVRQIYEENGLFKFHREKPPEPVFRTRDEACQRNLIWHTDIHYLDFPEMPRQYLIAFIDDASRSLMNWSVLTEKSAIATAEFLEVTFEMGLPKPYCIWSDNGGEFTGGRFRDRLKRYAIVWKTTEVRTLQQNGKIERFWQNVKHVQSMEELYVVFEDYDHRPHTGLPKRRIRGELVFSTPWQVYLELPSWEDGERTWTVDGQERELNSTKIQ